MPCLPVGGQISPKFAPSRGLVPLSQKLLGNLKFWKTAALQDLSLPITLVKAILKLSYCFVKFYDVINQYCSQSRGYGVSTCRVTVIHSVFKCN